MLLIRKTTPCLSVLMISTVSTRYVNWKRKYRREHRTELHCEVSGLSGSTSLRNTLRHKGSQRKTELAWAKSDLQYWVIMWSRLASCYIVFRLVETNHGRPKQLYWIWWSGKFEINFEVKLMVECLILGLLITSFQQKITQTCVIKGHVDNPEW
jgi:hypothetical protein